MPFFYYTCIYRNIQCRIFVNFNTYNIFHGIIMNTRQDSAVSYQSPAPAASHFERRISLESTCDFTAEKQLGTVPEKSPQVPPVSSGCHPKRPDGGNHHGDHRNHCGGKDLQL